MAVTVTTSTNSAVKALIDLTALKHNLKQVHNAAPSCKVLAVIKANGYGHGIVTIANTLQAAGVDALAVARFDEALKLRQAGIHTPLVCLEGLFDEAELIAACHAHVQPVVHHPSQVELLCRTKLPHAVNVWLKVDSGMHRMGLAPEYVQEMWQKLSQCESVKEIKLMTHLACADDRDSEHTRLQLDTFSRAIDGLSGETTIANSAGVLGWPDSHGDWVRPGIMLFGASPFENGRAESDGLLPVMTLKSRVIAVNQFRKGDTIGYGASWACPEDMQVAVVACGYGDGYPRHAVPGTPVLINGIRLSLVGRVSMDSICVDLRQASEVNIGDEAVLWGRGLPVEEVAEYATTIPYELLCSVTGRVTFEINV